VLPGDAPPLADGAIVLEEDLVVAVGPATDVIPRASGAVVERVRGVVFPGLVNAHTHLELSALRGKVTGGRGFIDWVERLIGMRLEVTAEEEEQAVGEAVLALDRAGTVAVGEVTNSLSAVHSLARAGIVGSIFHEVFGWDRERVMGRLRAVEAELHDKVGAWPTVELAYAPAPHTLYTTHPDVVRAAIDAARSRGRRTSVHLAEHPLERRAIEQGDGPVTDWLEVRTRQPRSSIPWPRRPLFDHAADMGALAEGVLLVHLTDARPSELARVRESGAAVVLCPRSNLHIETQLPPLLAMREAGLEPALGTDSLASSPSLDVLAEARSLADRFPQVPAWELVKMATANGARALGRSDLGRLAEGARPGVVAVEGSIASDPAAWLLAHLGAPRRFVSRRKS